MTLELENLKTQLIDSRASNTYRWFESRSENLPNTIYKNLDKVKLSLKIYLNSTNTHFRKDLSKSEKLSALRIIKHLVICFYNT